MQCTGQNVTDITGKLCEYSRVVIDFSMHIALGVCKYMYVTQYTLATVHGYKLSVQ